MVIGMIKKNFLSKSKILITGGTGSFGNAMTKALLNKNVKEIRIFSRDEKKQDDMRKLYNNNKIKFYIGDIRDSNSVKNAVRDIDYIFHAAALKQVPSCEFYPMEAVKTNILGVENVLNHACEANVKKIVCLSTDKAVYPINAMGVSKAMMEKIIIAKSRFLNKNNKTKICITRYGNVICSRGSVIPLFVDFIKKGKPILVTDLSMTRFMMSLEEAIDLVFFAFVSGNNGDILIKKSPAATISTVIDSLSEIFNKKIFKKVIGPRHGEKFHETLMTKEEHLASKNFKNYFQIPSDTRDLNYEKYFSKGRKKIKIFNDYTSSNTNILNKKETTLLLKPILKQNNY
jgi:UDP-N-acetylglucosamine 4,6-dehydratase